MKHNLHNQSIRATIQLKTKFLIRLKSVSLPLVICIVVACGGQGSSENTATKLLPQVDSQTKTEASAQKTESSSLLASLAREYPNGQLPAERAAEAAKSLSQNPSVFKNSAAITSQSSVSSQNIQAQAFTEVDFKPVYRIQNTTLSGSYFFTIYEAEKTAALAANPNWKLEGPAFYTLPAASTDLSPVYRFRNKVNGSYLYTAYESEKTDIQTNYGATYELEGVAWRAQQTVAPGYTALYRFRNLTNGTYLNTSYESEKDAIVRDYPLIFKLEGIAYYVRNDNTTPLPDPELNLACSAQLPKKTLATLPASYSAKLLDSSFDASSSVFLTNTGYVAWRGITRSSMTDVTAYLKLYNNSTNTVFSKLINSIGPLIFTESVVSLNDAGVLLYRTGSMDQQLELSTLPFAKLWDGVSTTDSVVKAPQTINHRAGRHTFLDSYPTAQLRKWLNLETVSYLDGNVLVKTSDTTFAGPSPLGTNRCGITVDPWKSQSANTEDGLFFLRGYTKLNRFGLLFSVVDAAYPRYHINGLNDAGSIFGSLSDVPKTFPMLGFIRTTTSHNYYPNSEVVDVNDANTGIGYLAAVYTLVATGATFKTIYPAEGQIMVKDGVQNLKSVVPTLAGSVDVLVPKAINNSGQIVVQTCTPDGYGGCVRPNKLYLLTPQ